MENVSLIGLPEQDQECSTLPMTDQFALAFASSAPSQVLLEQMVDSRPTACIVFVEH